MNTKERILEIALDLFSQFGFNGVTVRQIADAVGIKASSIYNHFDNKQDILDTIVETHINRSTDYFEIAYNHKLFNEIQHVNDEKFIDTSLKIIKFYLQDEDIIKFRRVLILEQIHKSKYSALYNKIFINDVLQYQTLVFNRFIELNYLIKADPYLLVLQFCSPIFIFFNRFNKVTNQEIQTIKEHINFFLETYKSKG